MAQSGEMAAQGWLTTKPSRWREPLSWWRDVTACAPAERGMSGGGEEEEEGGRRLLLGMPPREEEDIARWEGGALHTRWDRRRALHTRWDRTREEGGYDRAGRTEGGGGVEKTRGRASK
jgi:hypothetical protein